MKFKCPLIVVSNIEQSRFFYEKILKQQIKYNFGENITYEGDFSIQLKSHFANMITIDEKDIKNKSNNFELYFEEDDIESFVKRLKSFNEIILIHELIEHPWGQRVIRFYDPDNHIIEVGESMESVVRRFIGKGLSIEDTAKITQHPIDFVRSCL